MLLPRLSRLSPDAAKNLCACQSPVARVPVIPSGGFDFRVLCVSGFGSPARFVRPGRSCGMSRWIPSGRKPDPTFSVGKTLGALSTPQQPTRAGQGAHPRAPGRWSRAAGRWSRVTGRQSRAAGCPSPHSRLSMLAPTSRLSTLELSTIDPFRRPASRWARLRRSPDPTFSVGKTCGALSPPQQPIRVGQGAHPRAPGRWSRVTGRRSLPKSFTMRSYTKTCLQVLCNVQLQIIGLKVLCNEQLRKIPGG
jgi:hypothetical protein